MFHVQVIFSAKIANWVIVTWHADDAWHSYDHSRAPPTLTSFQFSNLFCAKSSSFTELHFFFRSSGAPAWSMPQSLSTSTWGTLRSVKLLERLRKTRSVEREKMLLVTPISWLCVSKKEKKNEWNAINKLVGSRKGWRKRAALWHRPVLTVVKSTNDYTKLALVFAVVKKCKWQLKVTFDEASVLVVEASTTPAQLRCRSFAQSHTSLRALRVT